MNEVNYSMEVRWVDVTETVTLAELWKHSEATNEPIQVNNGRVYIPITIESINLPEVDE